MTPSELQSAFAAPGVIRLPHGVHVATAPLVLPEGRTVISEGATLKGVFAGPVLSLRSGFRLLGSLTVHGNDVPPKHTPGSWGVRLGGEGVSCQQGYAECLEVAFFERGIVAEQRAVDSGIYHNHFTRTRVSYCVSGVELRTTGPGSYNVNANHFGTLSVQNCGEGLTVDGADGNTFDHLEVEACKGNAVDVRRSKYFTQSAGWLEGNGANYRIANYPAVETVRIQTSMDGGVWNDKKFICGFDTRRQVSVVSNYGRFEFGN